MKSNYQIIRNSLLTLALVAGLAPFNVHALGSTPVTVVNPTPIPVGITGTPNVNVTNTVPVTGNVSITNSSDIAKAQGIQHPFQIRLEGNAINSYISVAGYQVPANQRLVVESVEAECTFSSTQVPVAFKLSTTVNSSFVEHILNIDPNQFRRPLYQQSQQVRFYADAGSSVGIAIFADSTSSLIGYPNCNFYLSGQLVDAP